MKLLNILSLDRIAHRLENNDKEELLRELVQRCVLGNEPPSGISPNDLDRIVEVLLEREGLGSTGIGDNVAIPHGKFFGLHNLVAGLGIHSTGIDYGALDGKPTQFFVVLLAPESSAGIHLKALARIARIFRDPGFRNRLLEAPDSQSVFDSIAEEDARH